MKLIVSDFHRLMLKATKILAFDWPRASLSVIITDKMPIDRKLFLTNGTGRPSPAAEALTAKVHTIPNRRLADTPILTGAAAAGVHSWRLKQNPLSSELVILRLCLSQ